MTLNPFKHIKRLENRINQLDDRITKLERKFGAMDSEVVTYTFMVTKSYPEFVKQVDDFARRMEKLHTCNRNEIKRLSKELNRLKYGK